MPKVKSPNFKVAMVANDNPPTPDWVLRELAAHDIELVEQACAGDNDLARVAGQADVVWVFGGARVLSPEALPRLKRCRAILRTGTGTDNIPVDEASRLGIVVANTPEATMHIVAEHALGLLFAVIRRIAVQDRAIRQGIWDRNYAWPNWHLVGQTLGLVGFGRIGQLVAKKAGGLELTTKLDNVVLTPHIAGYSDDFWEKFWGHSIRTIVEMSRGRLPLWVVNPHATPWWQPAKSAGNPDLDNR